VLAQHLTSFCPPIAPAFKVAMTLSRAPLAPFFMPA
jgi:hypothetical protein